jgi:hypothetical protein
MHKKYGISKYCSFDRQNIVLCCLPYLNLCQVIVVQQHCATATSFHYTNLHFKISGHTLAGAYPYYVKPSSKDWFGTKPIGSVFDPAIDHPYIHEE